MGVTRRAYICWVCATRRPTCRGIGSEVGCDSRNCVWRN